MPAFEIAGQKGFEWLNLAQLRQSADGTWYVLHDATVDRTTDGTGSIANLTDSYLSTIHIDVGENIDQYSQEELIIPTLEDAIKIARKYGMKLYFRIATVTAGLSNFFEIINKYRCDGMIFGGNSLTDILPFASKGYCVNWDAQTSDAVVEQMNLYKNYGIKNATIFTSLNIITDSIIKTARDNGFKVMVFDPSDTSATLTKQQAQLLSDMGVDIVSSALRFNLAE